MDIRHHALRPYLETIEAECDRLDRTKLTKLVLTLASQASPPNREVFLENVRSIMSIENNSATISPVIDIAELQADIDQLHQTIRARLNSIGDGTYWSEPDDDEWDDSYHLDHEPKPVNVEQAAALTDLLATADSHFINGKKIVAKTIYSGVFAILEEIGDYGMLADISCDLHETRARLVRCEYLLCEKDQRVEAIWAPMKVVSEEDDFDRCNFNTLPLLQDILDAKTDDLPNLDAFLVSWQRALSKQNYRRGRVADLLLEAVFLQSGVEAVADLARNWKNDQPRGYLYWLQQLERSEDWLLLRSVSLETLDVLPAGDNRLKASNYLISAGKNLEDDKTSLIGFRERFMASLEEGSLLDLLTEAARQQLRTEELEKVCIYCADTIPKSEKQNLLIKAFLMAGKLDEAFALCEQDEVCGWAYSSTGLLFASILYLLCGGKAACSVVHQQLITYSDSRGVSFGCYSDYSSYSSRSAFDEIKHGLDLVDPKTIDLNFYRKWAGGIGEQRVNDIVSNTLKIG